MRHVLRSSIVVGVLALTAFSVSACKVAGGSVEPITGPTPVPGPGPAPAPAFDTSVRRLVDGAGNEGPVTVRIEKLDLRPNFANAYFSVEICMDAVPNARNSPFLAKSTVWPMWSVDGVAPMANLPTDQSVLLPIVRVVNGECVYWNSPPLLFPAPAARYLTFAGDWGPNLGKWNDNPCPSLEGIANQKASADSQEVPCVFRVAPAYELKY